MKHLKKFESGAVAGGSMPVDIGSLSPTMRRNNANPAVEFEEEIDEPYLMMKDMSIKFDLHMKQSTNSYDIMDDIRTYLYNKYGDNISNIETNSGGWVD